MPTATAKAAPKTATVSEKVIRTEVRQPVEVPVTPPAPVDVAPSEDFWRYIEQLSEEDWKKHHVSLYRYPLGQTKPQKLGRYIRTYKADAPLKSEEQVFEEFGGGQYDALLRGPGAEGRVTLIAKQSWEMDGPVKNPWQSSGPTAPGAPSNSDLASTLQVVLQNLKAAERSPNLGGDPALKESIALIQQLTAAMPKPEGVKELVAGLASLKQLTGDGGGKNSIIETIQVLKELGLVGEKRRSLSEELKDILEIAASVGGNGGGGGGRIDWPTALVQNLPGILEKVTPIADKFADAARSNARVAELRAGGRPAALPSSPVNRTLPAVTVPPAAVPVPAAESPAPRAVAAPETEPAAASATGAAPVNAPAEFAFRPPNLVWVKGRAVQMFTEGKPGDVIAEFLDNLDAQLGQFLASMDEPAFRLFVEGDAILKQISTAPRYASFVRDFVDYFSEQPDDGVSDKAPAK
jgi:hypothetical protein